MAACNADLGSDVAGGSTFGRRSQAAARAGMRWEHPLHGIRLAARRQFGKNAGDADQQARRGNPRGRLVDPSAGGMLNPGPIPNWEFRESIRHESVVPGVAAEESGKKSAG